jgi:hypothetical protein
MSQSSATGNGESDSIKPNRFNGKTSWSAWKMKTLAFLQARNLRDVVVKDPGIFRISEGEMNVISKADLAILMKKSEKAYSLLLNLLEDEIIDLVAPAEAGDAFHLWKILLDTYEIKSTANLCTKLNLLMNIKFNQDKESFDSFRSRFNKLLMELKEMDEIISQAMQRYVLLRSLSSSFDGLVMLFKVNDELTIEELCTHIKDHIATSRLNHRERTTGNERVLYANTASGHSNRRGVCFVCGSADHYAGECPKKFSSADESDDRDHGHRHKKHGSGKRVMHEA